MADSQHGARLTALRRADPPGLGSVTLTGRLESNNSGTLYVGHLGDDKVVVVLLSAGAETDSYARKRFLDALVELQADCPGRVAQFDDDVDIAPWAAVRADDWDDGLADARALLAPVALEHLEQVGSAAGPDFRPHWFRRHGAGRWRLWPLPWPRRLTQAGWWTFVASFALILAIATLALWISIKVFEDQPRPQPGPGPGPGPNPPPNSSSPTPSSTNPTTASPPGPPTPGGTGQPIPPIV
ncbi:MAG: hypothetical protein H0T17_03995 [Propionibacteriales bacterium]|nr:hypothetical protein [Propionibacteriales bacterium]